MEEAVDIASVADIGLIVGSSLVVYPAAGLMDYFPNHAPIYVVDPNMPAVSPRPNLHLIEEVASKGLVKVKNNLLKEAGR